MKAVKRILLGCLVFVVGIIGTKITLSMISETSIQKETPNFIVDSRAITNKIEKEINPLSGKNIYFAGIEDVTINKECVVELSNVPENEDFYMKYEVINSDTGEVIFITDMIPAGEHINWIPGKTLSEGIYNLSFIMKPYYLDEGNNPVELTNGCNTVTITII